MSQAATFDQMIAALKRWKVPFVVLPGAATHNRAGHGPWGDMHGFCNHHSASRADGMAYAQGTLYEGRPDLPGPLCNWGLARNGLVYVTGWGRANHAGAVRQEVLDALLADRAPTRPSTTLGETVDANGFLYGVEVMNDGVGEPYPPDQIESLVRLNAAMLEFHGWSETSSTQHYEITRRKIDMAPIDGHEAGPFVRAQVALALHEGPDGYHYPGSTRWSGSAAPVAPAVPPVAPPPPAPHPAPAPAPAPAPHPSPSPLPGVPVRKMPYPGPAPFRIGVASEATLHLGCALVLAGFGGQYRSGPSRLFGAADKAACAAFQRSQGWTGTDANGIPGPQTWHRLGLD